MGSQTLRQATKLWQEETEPEFGRPSGDLGIDEAIPWLRKARQARRCEPRTAGIEAPSQGAAAPGARMSA